MLFFSKVRLKPQAELINCLKQGCWSPNCCSRDGIHQRTQLVMFSWWSNIQMSRLQARGDVHLTGVIVAASCLIHSTTQSHHRSVSLTFIHVRALVVTLLHRRGAWCLIFSIKLDVQNETSSLMSKMRQQGKSLAIGELLRIYLVVPSG